MTDIDQFNNIYLNLEIRKSSGKTDEFGNYIFEVEASNENLDLQNQIVLQNALLESKDEFLKGGVISFDHLHKRKDKDGNIISDPSMVIGEPIEVKTDGTKTIVKGKLYKTNEKAKEIIKMLKAHSTRVRASVGGIYPQVEKNLRTGVETVTHVLWNDLALTTSPVNITVGAACFAKSMNPDEFVKALTAGYGTDSATFTGGRALIPENAGTVVSLLDELAHKIGAGEISGKEEAVKYLTNKGIEADKANDIVCEIIHQGGQKMGVKKSFSQTVSELLKSLTNNANDDEIVKSQCKKSTDDDDINNGDDDEGNEGNDDDEGNEGNDDEEDLKKSFLDGTEVLQAIDGELKAMHKSMSNQDERIEDLGKALTDLAQMVYAIGSEKLPPKSVLNKSFNAAEKTNVQQGRPSQEDFDRVQDCLIRCVKEGKIDIQKSSLISSDMQKCMYTGAPMKQEYYDFLVKELKG